MTWIYMTCGEERVVGRLWCTSKKRGSGRTVGTVKRYISRGNEKRGEGDTVIVTTVVTWMNPRASASVSGARIAI